MAPSLASMDGVPGQLSGISFLESFRVVDDSGVDHLFLFNSSSESWGDEAGYTETHRSQPVLKQHDLEMYLLARKQNPDSVGARDNLGRKCDRAHHKAWTDC